MSNPRINVRLLRQALAGQFSRVMFRNGEMDKFDSSFQELTNSQKQSLITLGNELASMELKIRLDNQPKLTQTIIDFPKFVALRPDLITSFFEATCAECDSGCEWVFIEFQMGETVQGPRPITFSWQVYCYNHLPTLEE